MAQGKDPPRLTVALTFDHDAISAEVMRGGGPVLLSRGEFGPRVGVPRILSLLERYDIPATFFVPGHTLATFPASVRSIMAAGHELACHGWAHEDLATLDEATERDIMTRSFQAIGDAAGRPPDGFRAPFWSLSPRTLALAAKLGFRYDSSLMSDDVRLARVRVGDRHDLRASVLGQPGPLVEVPISWSLDDWPHFEPGGVLTLTMHPEAIGRGHRMAMLERFIGVVRSLDGVVFDRLDAVVERWVAANPA